MGRYIFAFVVGGAIVTVGLLSVAFVSTGGRVEMGIYDWLAVPLIFLAGGATGVCITLWVRRRSKK